MALAAGLHGCVRTSFYRPGKIERFGANFKVRILVDNETIRPFRKITGKLVIETRFPISHKGIQIQFEALCSLRYTTKFDNRTTFHQVRAHLLDNDRRDVVGCYEFPIGQELLPPSEYTILPGSVTFPFSLDFPDPHLPAPFKNAFGNLTYRVVVYMKASSTFVEIGEKAMRFNGHYNLTDNLDSLKPISIEQFYKKSVFSRKRLVEATFSLETSGYLPEERIQFVLYIRNLKCIPLQMSVQLVQQLKYDASNRIDSAKRKSIIIASCERDEFEPEPEFTWIDTLRIPEDLGPSYTIHSMYNVTYTIQFKIRVLDQGTIKGEAPIYIGTTREPVQLLMLSANNLDVPYQGLRRRGSASSNHSARSHSSATTTCSLPPAYSQLSSRIPSMEALPPSYDEALFSDHDNTHILALEVPTMMDRQLATTPELPEEASDGDEPKDES